MTPNLRSYGAYAYACTAVYCAERGYKLLLQDPAGLRALYTASSTVSASASASASVSASASGPADRNSRDKRTEEMRPPLLYDDLGDEGRDQRWTKVWLLHQAVTDRLASGRCTGTGTGTGQECYLVWMDSDLIAVDMHLRLERYTASFPHAGLLASRDFKQEHGVINSGFLIVRVGPWAERCLRAWWTQYPRQQWSDQGAFSRLAHDAVLQVRINISGHVYSIVCFCLYLSLPCTKPSALNTPPSPSAHTETPGP